MDPSIIVLDSSDEESGEPKRRKMAPQTPTGLNGGAHVFNKSPDQAKIRRIKPITIATNLSKEAENNNRTPVNENFAVISFSDEWEKDHLRYQQIIKEHEQQQRMQSKKKSPLSALAEEEANDRKTATPGSSSTADSHSTGRSSEKKEKRSSNVEKNPIGKEFADLLEACRKADSSKEMELLIQKKLIKYYECVHPDYINSKSFKKTLSAVTQDVNAQPELVYLKLASIVEELNIRRKSRNSVITNENVTTTGSEKKDNQIRRLNRALYILKKRIAKLEEMEVDFDEGINSSYMMEERYKKRAFEIYEKICDITGESKHAHRITRKPIKFDGTHYQEFNRTIQTFVNRTNTFPDFFDVLKCLQHCNTQYGYRMRREEMTKIAQDAFIKIGKLLQKRRKTDLYEMVSYYSGTDKDPAVVDKKLHEKLEENKKHYGKIGDIIDKFARVQDNDTDEEGEPSHSSKPSSSTKPATVVSSSSCKDTPDESKDSNVPASSSTISLFDTSSEDPPVVERTSSPAEAADKNDETSSSSNKVNVEGEEVPAAKTDEPVEDEVEDDDDEEEDEEDEMLIKENVKPDTFDDIDISDDEELIVPTS
ncbi:daxx-like protein isoform X1 [Aedes albopictus]|uniref:Daxx histone-binding domain-containing protein n=2 Tax=Aedes albopictus TaxID=7160 RepID=A0ABM1YWF0_AEDAL